jgi:hypothetical protein
MKARDRALLGRAAARLEGNPAFLVHVLALYRDHRGIDDAALAEELGCDGEGLVRLALCRAPRQGTDFRTDLASAAAHAGADLDRLISAVRRAQSIATLRAAAGANLLLAARDRDHGEPGADRTGDRGE